MREDEFRDWLGRRRYQGKELTTVNQRLNWCRAVERALPELGFAESDLDTIHAGGRWPDLLSAVSKLRSNWRNNEAAARVIAPKSDNPAGQMANARSSIGLYGRFADGDDPNYDDGIDRHDGPITDEAIFQHFKKKPEFAEWVSTWSRPDTAAFLRIVRSTHEAGVDWYHLRMSREVRCGRKKIGAVDANEVYAQISGRAPYAYVRKPEDREALGVADDWISLDLFADALYAAPDALSRFKIGREGYWPDQVNPDPADSEDSASRSGPASNQPTNLILYGPPGTGKTYRTAKEAVALCDGAADFPETVEGRSALLARYRELENEKRIGFVTFHQSYDYETFVEGLRPETSGDETSSAGFRLDPKPGIFREICALADQARTRARLPEGASEFDFTGRRFWKMGQGAIGTEDDVYEDALANNYIALGWGGAIDWSPERFSSFEAIKSEWLERNPDNQIPSNWTQTYPFRCEMKPRDIVIIPYGNSAFRAVAEVTGDYYFVASAEGYYGHRRPVRWLLVLDEPLPLDTVVDGNFTMRTLYSIGTKRVNTQALGRLLAGDEEQHSETVPGGPPDQFVLIIDEINRANISKVFGELITLIEPDKRLGMPNALTVTLPYSRKKDFGVPANLHIVGTMNTADRSIAQLDTALRRRFVFREIAPEPSLLPEEADGVPLRRVLERMNDRIEYLIDREHRIGHAFFMGDGGTDRQAIDRTMRDKVIPLLQEYFFDDWGRIAAVLGEPAGGGFLDCRKLTDPLGEGEDRTSWSVRVNFAPDAYDRLIGKTQFAIAEAAE